MSSFAWARRTLQFLGIDRAVAFTLAGHIWNAATAPLLAVLIVTRLNGNERGVIFNFNAIGQYLLLFEMGIGTVIQQLASRERASLMLLADGTLGGDAAAKARLAALFRIGLSWFVTLMIVGGVVLLPVGWGIFSYSPGVEHVAWQLGWTLTILVAVVQGVVFSTYLFLSGAGFVTGVARITAVQWGLATAGSIVALAAGLRVLSHPLSMTVGLTVSLVWLVWTKRKLLNDLWRTDHRDGGFGWKADVWPMQWRVSVTWLSVMIVIQVINQMVLVCQGAEAAGRVGLSMYVLMMIQAVGSGWVGTKVPTFGVLAAREEWAELDRLFRSVLWRTLALLAGLSAFFVLASTVIYYMPRTLLQEALLAPRPLALLALTILVIHILGTQMSYLRAHGREPMLPVALTMAVAVIVTLSVTGKFGTTDDMILGYTFWIVAIGLGGGTLLFLTKRRQWHRPAAAPATEPCVGQTVP